MTKEILAYVSQDKHQDFLNILSDFDEQINKKGKYYSDKSLKLLAQKIKDANFFEGIKIAEIGGSVSKRLFSELGVNVQAIDAGYDDDRDNKIVDENKIVNLRNYKIFFPEQYDIVCAVNVIESGSSIEEAIKMGGARPYELLIIEYDIVKEGGIILNESSTDVILNQEKRHPSRYEYERFKKNNPKNIVSLSDDVKKIAYNNLQELKGKFYVRKI